MKIYQFYSDFNDQYSTSIPREIRDDASYNNKQIPEKYRGRNLDLFITDIKDLLPKDLQNYEAIQIWWSGNKKSWKMVLWYSSNMNKIKLVKEKYNDTIKKLDQFPDYTPINMFAFLLSCVFVSHWGDYRNLMEKYDIITTQKPLTGD